ncbi:MULTISPECIES: hypothetical protein [unclassified Enterobacter]|uniref:hypothetical protein n=1 Tax=unclassified Enterobacter TaxID=2608935 RepID=UPI0023658397|nr:MULTISPECIES: hypothetical protein [unclassified Enterobacter]
MKKINLKDAVGAILFFVILSMAETAFAVDVILTTEFKADSTKPNNNEFINTTPTSGFCKFFPSSCLPGEFSVVVPGFKAYKNFDTDSQDINKHTYITLDGTSKSIILTDVNNPQKKITAEFRWAFFGVRHNRINESDGSLIDAMTHTGLAPSGGCSPRTGGGYPYWYSHGWGVPERVLSCYRMLNKEYPYRGTVLIDDLSIGYTLKTPAPLSVRSGQYEGVVVYRVGDVVNTPGYIGLGAEDYDGNDEIRIIIKAKVEHAFKVDFPAGSEQVKLAPKRGWSQWINGGHVPDLLHKEVPFILTSSTGFKINMLCEHNQGQNCGLKNIQTNEVVPLELLMSLPGFIGEGGVISKTPLTNISRGHIIPPPKEAIFDRRSTLDFQVKKKGVETMIKEPGSTWRGMVTLIFDTEIE